MFQIGRAGDAEEALTPLLTRFAHWSEARAAVQTATLVVAAIALAIAIADGTWPAAERENGHVAST